MIALATLARKPAVATAQKVALQLHEGAVAGYTALSAVAMLELAAELPTPPRADFDLMLCEAALGALGSGRLAAGRPLDGLDPSIALRLVIVLLERLNIQVSATQGDYPMTRVLDVWNGCYSLIGDNAMIASDQEIWRLYLNVASLSVLLWNKEKRDSFSDALVTFTIRVIKTNPTIAVAARCDLSSPYDKLRAAIAGRRDLVKPLEEAVAIATGCSPGRYAPEEE